MSTSRRSWPVIGVVGACGGAGASAWAAALAVCRTGSGGTPVLLDLDGPGGGIDVLLGAERSPGPRWSGLHATGDRLDPGQLRDGLPRWCDVAFLACDGPHEPDPRAVRSVVRAARDVGIVVIDLGRYATAARTAALADVDRLVLVVPGEIRAVTAGAAQQASIDDAGFGGTVGMLARLDRPVISPERMAEVLDVELAGVIGIDRGLRGGRDRGIEPRRLARATLRVARHVVDAAIDLEPSTSDPTGTYRSLSPAVDQEPDDPLRMLPPRRHRSGIPA